MKPEVLERRAGACDDVAVVGEILYVKMAQASRPELMPDKGGRARRTELCVGQA